ncbi:uncharacterized protein N7482_003996 [Penicillium canariense]|uniref:Tafazzin n=1 Tax=Penicillium canariense TaxID=189055 RepID=A0A9W9LP65_9EURO|nr:uncharacterized protein N7482_003996 [Penicillium canariense]KAJ5168402.1 hypothetical protein N7482_003996 [Penicillium canariense]
MPKKQKRSFVFKLADTPHHTLTSGPAQNDQTRRPAGSATSEAPSVNDLISHLRRTQATSSPEHNPSSSPRSFTSQRSVHPSLRNLLEVPETPPPRPRPGSRRTAIGGRPVRLTPGPPPPDSWLSHNREGSFEEAALATTGYDRVTLYRLDRLPGAKFPDKSSLVHAVLKSMALNLAWHLDYDGAFLAQIPSHLKQLLLSYIAVYPVYAGSQSLKGRMRGLKPLFLTEADTVATGGDEAEADLNVATDIDAGISRLDLGWALGYWITFKQLSGELFVSAKSAPATSQAEPEESVPGSWDEESNNGYEEDSTPSAATIGAIPKSISHSLRFNNLRYLSLAHPAPAAASWNSLLHLLSRLSIITHLSLAHWPPPTRTPRSAPARMRPPNHRGPTLVHGGTDVYSGMENNWAEAAGILRQLSRYTYCLKWLDLEGCSEWLAALTWTGNDPDGRPSHPGTSGPEWNGSWRDIEWIGLGPGFEYPSDKDLLRPIERPISAIQSMPPATQFPSSSLAASMHAPVDASQNFPTQNQSAHNDPPRSPPPSDLPWNVEEERWLYRRDRERQAWCDAISKAREVRIEIQAIRRQVRGKWIHAFTGGEEGSHDGRQKHKVS